MGWAGSIVNSDDGDPVTFVSGQWTVPDVVPPPGDHGLSACATWIGIDDLGSDSGDILQTGTTQQVTYGHAPTTFAWFEWFPEDPVTVTNLSVRPGDVMYALICVYSPVEAAVYLGNTTTGQLVSFIKDAPENISLSGQTAEWVLECPQFEDGSFAILTKFGDVYFDNCIAGTSGRDPLQIVLAGTGTPLVMQGEIDGGNPVDIASPVPLNDRAFKVQYVAPG
ncbi:MAG TPA: G1 family glutamic endopeptidase [Micromonosporaceae bacterium]